MQTSNFSDQLKQESADQKSKGNRSIKGLRYFLMIAIGCLAVGVLAQQGQSNGVLSKKRESVNSIPREYGRLVAVDRSTKDTTMYFEAPDGTIRFVSVIYGIDQGSLTFRAVTVPRD